MNAEDVLLYGHRTVMKTIAGLPEEDWQTPGVTGFWSVKDVIAHMASHELAFLEILESFVEDIPTPTLDKFKQGIGIFNDPEVEARSHMSPGQVLDEYERTHARTLESIVQIPESQRRQTGRLPWYGNEYDLEDFITYGVYGHKREHSAQIDAYRSRIGR